MACKEREKKGGGNEKRIKNHFAAVLSKKKPITSKLLTYPSEIFYIKAFKYISQYYIRKYFIYRNPTCTKLDSRSPESLVKSYCINKHWEITIPLCSWIWNKICEESLQFDDSNFKNFNLRFIDSLVTMVILRLLFISVMTPRENPRSLKWRHVIEWIGHIFRRFQFSFYCLAEASGHLFKCLMLFTFKF